MKNYAKRLILFSGFLLIAFSIFAADKKNINIRLFTVKTTPNVKSFLYFQGNIQPLKQISVLTPIAGLVGKRLNFSYGALVHKGQFLLSIVPDDRKNEYRSALIAYLRAKSSYGDSLAKFTGQKLLFKKGILARNNFTQYKNNLIDQKLALKEAFYNLEVIIRKTSNDAQAEQKLLRNLANLTIDNSKVYNALDQTFNQIKIDSPITGIALLPISNNTNDENNSRKALSANSSVKSNQELLTIGDFTGLKVNIDVSEVSINKLHKGQVAIVSGPAFPNINLTGQISTISYQANPNSFSGSLPTYPVSIVVPKLTAKQRKIIHPGMTAKVKITLDEGKQILIPIKAIDIESGKAYVMKKINNKFIKTRIVTGTTTINTVEVLEGLQAGDKIAISH